MIPHNKPTIGDEEITAASGAMANLELTMGKKVTEFENLFSNFIGLPSIAVSSGTTALHLALIILGISKDDEVILPSYTCFAVALPILYQRSTPILADVDDDFNISADEIKKNISDKTKAVIVPHMFGYPADLNEIKEICVDNDVFLIEDCAQSLGAEYQGLKVGTVGDISIQSFYSTKMITSIQGGMISTRNLDWLRDIRDLRYHDQIRGNEDKDDRLKFSYMMSDISAAVGAVQLKRLNEFIKARRSIAHIYDENLPNSISLPPVNADKKHVYSRYVVKLPFESQPIIQGMKEEGIMCEVMHNPPLHKRKAINKFNKGGSFLKTEDAIKRSISLPIFPTLSQDEAMNVCKSLKSFMPM